jgi:pyruvate/2-oxoglutarate dehydrogenase complex dihydrolipoamide dehydrogenase (E3) component
MAVDYDLVIMGGTDAARWAAITAVRFHARVALVGHQIELRGPNDTPAALASLGIDVVEAEGHFVKRPNLRVEVPDRVLRSHHYLLALAPTPMPGSSYLDINTAGAKAHSGPQSWLVIGDGPTALQFSQRLVKQGHDITLAARTRLLPLEEPDAAILLQAKLEADGVCVLTHTPIPADPAFDQVLLGSRSFPTSHIVWAEDSPSVPSPLSQSLGLAHTSQGLWVNANLRTSHPRVYACGAMLGGYNLPHIARYEASLAVKNALFLSTHAIDYYSLPWAILTEPALARVGLTTAQAQKRYRQIKVLRQPYPTADLTHGQMGLCQLIARDSGVLVGAHLVGTAAAEMIHLLALAVQQQRTVSEIADWPFIDATVSDLIRQTAQEPEQQRDSLERLFHRRRRWNF